jgi:glutaredoxin
VVETVTLFYNQGCPICRQARARLTDLMAERRIPFQAKEVTADVNNRDLLILTSGQIGAPVVLVDRREVVGIDRARLQYLLGVDVGQDHAAHW